MSKPVFDGTGVNATVGAVLAVAAVAGAKKKMAAKLDKRDGSYWMENIVQKRCISLCASRLQGNLRIVSSNLLCDH